MKFHWPSFMIGCAVGAGAMLVGNRLRPVLVEVATAVYELTDTVIARLTMVREDVDDALAEARAQARTRAASRTRARKRA
jgi:hypothetical protein